MTRFGWPESDITRVLTVDISMSLSEHLARRAADQGDAMALTFVDYTTDRAGVEISRTYRQLDAATTALAARIAAVARAGDRVAILAPQGIEYVLAFLAALRAGVIAVPLFSPDLPGLADRLGLVLADCEPAVIATTTGTEAAVRAFLEAHGHEAVILAVDDPAAAAPGPFEPPSVAFDDVAYLQYTSGSTRSPAGVLITHGNVVANTAQAIVAYRGQAGHNTIVSWLPLFHDMGLVFVVGGSVVGGFPTVFMDPVSFLLSPARWLRQVAKRPGSLTPAPNFAFDLCSKRIKEKDRAELDLTNVAGMINGAEPIRPGSLETFTEVFGPRGFDPRAHCPSYGLAEATVFVSGSSPGDQVRQLEVDRDRLTAGQATTEIAPGATATTLISCGRPVGQVIAIVDPDTFHACPEDAVGEIWVHGPNVASGYWGRPDLTAEVFGQTLADAEPPAGLPSGPWLRTGDLGVIHDGDLYVTGRIKDLVIIDGRNHYPQDIEVSTESGHPVIATGRAAAFSVPTDDGEGLVVVAEISRHALDGGWVRSEVTRAVRAAVSSRHGVAPHDIVLALPGEVPRTSSGKIARRACRQRFLDGGINRAGDGA